MAARPERLFDVLFEESSDAAYLMDPVDDRIIEANRAGCALLGYTRAELLRATVSHIHPAEMPQLRRFLDGALRDGRASTTVFTCRTRSGTFLPTEISLHVVESEGRRYVLGLVQDRSEHRQAGRRGAC
jgi:PAS domain S-box-containing protein